MSGRYQRSDAPALEQVDSRSIPETPSEKDGKQTYDGEVAIGSANISVSTASTSTEKLPLATTQAVPAASAFGDWLLVSFGFRQKSRRPDLDGVSLESGAPLLHARRR